MNEWLRNLISGYYNYNKPETFDGNPKPHYTDNIDKVEQLKRAARGYNNYTPPKTFGGERLPHYTDNIDKAEQIKKAVSGYYNLTPSGPHYLDKKNPLDELPNNFLSPDQRIRYLMSQNLNQKRNPALFDMLKSLF